MDVLTHVLRAAAGGRARPAAEPTPERLEQLARSVAAGSYRVPAEKVAEAMLAARLSARGRSGRRD